MSNKLTDEELLAIAASQAHENKKDIEEPTDVHKFINDLKIKDGRDKVPAGVIYLHYKEAGGKTNKIFFFKQFLKVFPKTIRDSYYRYYFLDGSSFDLSDDYLWKVIKFENRTKVKQIKNKKVQEIIESGEFDKLIDDRINKLKMKNMKKKVK